MRNAVTKNTAKDWLRLAAKVSLLFTEPKVRAAVGDRIKDSVDDMTDSVAHTIAGKYDDAVDRLEAVADVFQGRNHWPSRLTGFLLGVGVGAGVGILLAPASGSEIRESVRHKVVGVRNKIHQSMAHMPSTGTEG